MMKPIIFSSTMVEAILNGRKTQTRRVADPSRDCPYRANELWVRETWATIKEYDHLAPRQIPKGDTRWPKVWYYAPRIAAASAQNTQSEFVGKKRPAIFMPRWASRITLQQKSVKIEKLQDITNNDILAEGVKDLQEWIELWDSINAPHGRSWDTNPWVWVIEFFEAVL